MSAQAGAPSPLRANLTKLGRNLNMPCDAIVLNRVELPKMDAKLAELALKEMGAKLLYPNLFEYKGQRYTITDQGLQSTAANVGQVADLLKRHYSAEVVKYSARRAGWQVKQKAPFQYEVIKTKSSRVDF